MKYQDKLSPFKYWVQRTLPQVYDDSLSFYELLNKVVKYLNDVIESQNITNENFIELKGMFDTLKTFVDNYFLNLDVQNEINNKLDTMASDGTLDTIINHNIFNNLNMQVEDISVTPIKNGAIGDGSTDDTEKLITTINTAIANNQSIESNKTYYVTSPIVIDLQGKYNINVKLRLKPKAGIGEVIRIKNGQNSNIDIGIFHGGSETDKGLVIEGLNSCRVRVRGYYFLGTLFNVVGSDKTNNKNVACDIDVKAERCGRGIIHGDGNITNAFGKYRSVFERNCTEGSIFQYAHDITIDHYENYFNQPGKKSLIITYCGSFHALNIALGGKADYLMEINDSRVTIDKLLFVNEDTPGENTKGLLINSTYYEQDNFNSTVTIGTLEGYDLFCMVDYNEKTKLSIDTLKPKRVITHVARRDGVSLNMPTNRLSSLYPAKHIYHDYTTTLHFPNYSGVYDSFMLKDLRKFMDDIGYVKIERKYLIISSLGTSNVYTTDVLFTKNFQNPPEVFTSSNTHYIISVQSLTNTGCTLVIKKADGTNFNNETIRISYMVIGE